MVPYGTQNDIDKKKGIIRIADTTSVKPNGFFIMA